jgi:hypothetical protein
MSTVVKKSQGEKFINNIRNLLATIQELNNKCAASKVPAISEATILAVRVALELYNSPEKRTEYMESFIKSTSTMWEFIRIKSDEYFLSNATDIFKLAGIDNKYMNELEVVKNILTVRDSSGNRVLSDADRDRIWVLMHNLVRVSANHIRITRKTIPDFFRMVNIDQVVRNWELEPI